MSRSRTCHGAVVAVDCIGRGADQQYDLGLIERLRADELPGTTMPIAIMAEQATAQLPSALRGRNIRRVIRKPFRAKVPLDTIGKFGALPRLPRPACAAPVAGITRQA